MASLARLKARDQLELIIVNAAGPAFVTAVAQLDRAATVVSLPGKPSFAQARQAGIERCSGDWIVILNERYAVNEAWWAALEAAMLTGADVVSGPVAPPSAAGGREWAIYLAEYAHLAPPVPCGWLDRAEAGRIPSGNVGYRRDLLSRIPMGDYLWELDYHAALVEAGGRFWRPEAMRATFASPHRTAEYLAERRRVSREYAALRFQHASVVTRVAGAAGRLLALPPLLLIRMVRQVWPKPELRRRLLVAAPVAVWFSLVQAAAEVTGILAGSGERAGGNASAAGRADGLFKDGQ